MTRGGSLDLRSGSHGSLQAYFNGTSFPASPASPPDFSPPVASVARKPAKMLVFVPRVKGLSLSCISKFVCRRRVGMLLVLAASAGLLLSLFSIHSKDYQVSGGPETHLSFLDPTKDDSRLNMPPPPSPPPPPPPPNMVAKEPSAGGNNKTLSSILGLRHYDVPAQHPCQNFLFAPPPPPNMKRRTGPRPCPVCYVPVEHAAAVIPDFSSPSPVIKNLSYVSDENFLLNKSKVGSLFGGQPSLQQRTESFNIRESMTVHCGFVKGKKPGRGTGFDIDDEDLLDMEQCRGVVIASAIFGNYDVLKQPKNISHLAKKTACFYMFVDEETETYIKNTNMLDSTKRIGLWRMVLVRNLPYSDPRRNGKVPKLLVHRMFPNARFSIWIDGKLELVVDPYQILERFLWRENATFAISNHYRRFDVFDEAEANKAGAKYNNASIDYQIEFYRREGLTPYSLAKLPIISDVPEGCVIIREHIPITNLFTCLWFNEVDHFTSRDQLSFSTVRDKIMSKVDWKINMFMDCERRNFVVQAYHRDLLQQQNTSASSSYPPPTSLPSESTAKKTTDSARETTVKYPPLKNTSMKRRKEKKSGPKRQHPKLAIAKDFPEM